MTFETINATLLTLTETSLNQLLGHNPEALRRLAELEGKVIGLKLEAPACSLSLRPHRKGLQIELIDQDDTDVTLSGNVSDFLRLLTAQEKTDALFGKSIRITGDSGLATRFSQILIDAGMDWEGILADIIGDLPAHQLGSYLRWKAAFYLNAGNSLMQNMEEYLKEEIRLLPTRPELEHFSDQVDTLSESTERAEARLQRLKTRLS